VTTAYEAPFEFTPGRLGTVTIEAAGRAFRDPSAETNAQIAMQ
jgi:hypothetical protein